VEHIALPFHSDDSARPDALLHRLVFRGLRRWVAVRAARRYALPEARAGNAREKARKNRALLANSHSSQTEFFRNEMARN
jgi:hypothetical protein